MSLLRGSTACALLAAAACATASTPPQSRSVEAASVELNRLAAAEPATFKMVHQVVVRFQGRSFPMSGYLLGRRDGSFRVSASAPMGPKLFEIAKLSGHWQTRLDLPAAASRLDPLEIGRAVERIYFIDAPGPPEFSDGAWVTRRTLSEDDVDAVAVWHRADDLSIVRKRFFRNGQQVQDIEYRQRQPMQGQPIAREVVLSDARGFTLELAVTAYEPGVPIPDQLLMLPPQR